VDYVNYYLEPVWLQIRPHVAPYLGPVYRAGLAWLAWLSEKLHAEPPPPVRPQGPRGSPVVPEPAVEQDINPEHIPGMGDAEPEHDDEL